DAEREFRRVLSFVGLSIDESALSSAVEASRFENMQRQERKQHDQLDVLRDSDASKRFIRKGKSGDWREEFGDQQHDRFIDSHGDALFRLDYIS
ncbi:MAG: hypothetical protein BRC56_01115, partial [Cyanobacteria bacterium SW_9_47_5]